MHSLKFDYETMRTGVIPQLDSVVDKLRTALNEANSMDVPNFSNSDYLNGTGSLISSSINEINHIINWINESNNTLDNLIDSYEKEAKYLPLYLLEKRDSVIK